METTRPPDLVHAANRDNRVSAPADRARQVRGEPRGTNGAVTDRMRATVICLFLVACSSSGKSVEPDDCTHTQQPTTACCLVDSECTSAICAPPGTPQACGSCNSEPATCTTDA